MSEFKSFDDFQKELHGELSESAPVAQEEIIQNPERPEKRKHKRRRKRFSLFHQHKKTQETEEKQGKAGRNLRIAGITAVVILGVFLFLPVPFGAIRISGSSEVTMNDVLLEGQIRQPVNVLQISTSNLAQRLSHDIRIESVDVSRSFPWYVDVKVTERHPCAIIQGDFAYATLDKNGMVMDTETSIKGTDLPIITGEKAGNILLGDTISDGTVQKALLFIQSLSPEGFKVFSEINIGQPDNIIAYTRDGIAVHLGSGDKMKDQASLAENMVGDVKARNLNVEYIDVNVSAPFIKLKQ
jgi:cell division protein FtsQ